MDDIYGLWGQKGNYGEPWLELALNGQAAGSDGCNRISGTFEVHEGRISFGPILSTLMYCQGVQTWLGAASSAEMNEGQLEIFDLTGQSIGVLRR